MTRRQVLAAIIILSTVTVAAEYSMAAAVSVIFLYALLPET